MQIHKFKIMGILNLTPDSFSDGGDNSNLNTILNNCEKMIANSVDIIDIGGESTRPGSETVTEEEELRRVLPVIEEIKKKFPEITLSIDTTKYEVAKAALERGVEIINDISGLQFEPKFAELAASFNAGLVIMHIKGNPKVMQMNPEYDDVVGDVYNFLDEKIKLAKNYGVSKIWSDVGIGFGKNLHHNLELLRHLDTFHNLKVPILLGISRKSFLGKILSIDNPKERDLATALMHSLLITKGVDIVRVHNIEYLNSLRQLVNEFFVC